MTSRSIAFDDSEWERAKQAAKQRNMSVFDFVRLAVHQECEGRQTDARSFAPDYSTRDTRCPQCGAIPKFAGGGKVTCGLCGHAWSP